MKHRFIHAALAATLLLLDASLSQAAETKAAATGEASKAAPGTQSADAAKSETKPQAAAAKRAKPVDINSAKKEELKKLPGIGDAEADKIIAGRPYGSKTWLVSDNIIPEELFHRISGLIEVKLPFKDTARNVEYLKKAAEKKKAAAEKKKADDKKK